MADINGLPDTAPLPMGLRLCRAYFGFAMGLSLVFGFLCSPHMFDYDISMVRVLLLMAGGTATMWLISQRARSARAVGAVTALVEEHGGIRPLIAEGVIEQHDQLGFGPGQGKAREEGVAAVLDLFSCGWIQGRPDHGKGFGLKHGPKRPP